MCRLSAASNVQGMPRTFYKTCSQFTEHGFLAQARHVIFSIAGQIAQILSQTARGGSGKISQSMQWSPSRLPTEWHMSTMCIIGLQGMATITVSQGLARFLLGGRCGNCDKELDAGPIAL